MQENAEKDIVSLVFHGKVDKDLFTLESKDLKEWRRKQTVNREKVNRLLKLKIPFKSQKELNYAIEKYLESVCEVSFWEGKEYYRTGFNDCFSIFMQHIK